jgi:pimeloyl-ACP methyl ester carboxylesterase
VVRYVKLVPEVNYQITMARDRRFFSLGLILATACALLTPASAKRLKPPAELVPKPSESEIQVGSLRLRRCKGVPAYCGAIIRALDPSGTTRGTIKVGFQLYPHVSSSLPQLETIVAMEGGPGYPTTESRHSYIGLFQPLMDRHDLLLVDHRGTGLSNALNCPLLQSELNPVHDGVSACGDTLGKAAYLYGTALAADDLTAVLDALAINQIDLYGDSYGTYFSQAFAVRHPQRLRALVLDSAYPIVGLSPWYPQIAPTIREGLRLVCQRSAACRDLPGDAGSRLDQLVAALREQPLSGTAQDGEGKTIAVTADPTNIAYLLFSNSTVLVVYREFDAAARAYLEHRDAVPLLRLVAENQKAGQTGGREIPISSYSAGAFVATSCASYPQLYDMTAHPADRAGQLERAITEKERTEPNVYAPFTVREFERMPLDDSVLDLCLNWPQAPSQISVGTPVPANAVFPSVPTLVFSAEFDPLTPWPQGAAAVKEFPNARHVIIQNSAHVVALEDADNCGSTLTRHFIQTLDARDTTCAGKVAEVHLVPKFAVNAADLDPATATAGNQADESDRRIVATAVQTLGDALARWWFNDTGKGAGLRGGRFKYKTAGSHSIYKLDSLHWTQDVSVSGQADWAYNFPGTVKAELRVVGPNGAKGALSVKWDGRVPGSMAEITGKMRNKNVAARIYAP